MTISDEEQRERFNAAAQIEEIAATEIARKQGYLQSKTIALLATIVALSIAMFSVPAATIDDTPLIALMPGGFLLIIGVLPGVRLIFGKTRAREPRLPPSTPHELDIFQMARSRWIFSRGTRARADAMLVIDSKRYWRWVKLASASVVFSFVMLVLIIIFTGR